MYGVNPIHGIPMELHSCDISECQLVTTKWYAAMVEHNVMIPAIKSAIWTPRNFFWLTNVNGARNGDGDKLKSSKATRTQNGKSSLVNCQLTKNLSPRIRKQSTRTTKWKGSECPSEPDRIRKHRRWTPWYPSIQDNDWRIWKNWDGSSRMKRTRKNVPHFPSQKIMTNIIIRNVRCAANA